MWSRGSKRSRALRKPGRTRRCACTLTCARSIFLNRERRESTLGLRLTQVEQRVHSSACVDRFLTVVVVVVAILLQSSKHVLAAAGAGGGADGTAHTFTVGESDFLLDGRR